MNYLYQFLLWWTSVLSFVFLFDKFWAKYSWLFYAIPIQFLISIFIIYSKNRNNNCIIEASKASFIGLILTLLFILVYILLLKRFSFYTSTVISIVFFMFFSYIYISFYKK
jgi:hypothetical protein